MTVNERLFEAGIIDQFDQAAIHGNGSKMMRLLSTVEMSDEQAKFTVDAILTNPKMYGYSK